MWSDPHSRVRISLRRGPAIFRQNLTPTMLPGGIIKHLFFVSGCMINNHAIVHLNHAGASPSSDAVLQRVVDHLHLEQRLGGYAAANAVREELSTGVYPAIATLLQAVSPDEIAVVESATVAWTRIFYAAAEHLHRHSNRKVILVSQVEYAANLVAACRWAQTHDGWTVRILPSERHEDGSSTGKVD